MTGVQTCALPISQSDPDVKAAVEKAALELGTSGRILVRESGTEPLVRVMAEAENEDICHACVDKIIDVLKRKGHTI